MVSISKEKNILISMIFSRGIYGLCWFNLSAAFPAMSAHFHYTSLEPLGVFTAVFLLGSGIFQIPAGLISAKIGAKSMVLSGLALVSVTSLAFVLTGDFIFQLAFRLLTGLGAAMYFAPGLGIVSTTLSRNRSGTAVGLYYAIFYLGSGAAVFAFAPLASSIDWRLPFIITAILTLVALLQNTVALRSWKMETANLTPRHLGAVFKSRMVWVAAIAILGVSSGYYIASQFSVTYSETQLHLSPVLAGTVSSLLLFGAIGGGPALGWVSDASRKRRKMILVGILGSAAMLALLSLPELAVVIFAMLALGFFASGTYTTAYSFPSQHNEIESNLVPLAVALMNSVAILCGAVAAPLFTYAVSISNYSVGWLLLGLVTVLLGPLIYLSKEPT